ncbi:hypothetical protein E4U42_006547 [Claviceps africana]|uniref:Uncharacterized protein n=1 Tax=Claviceps africana TaxID=83212 RepID=A0A8K0J284_9HYPO|nr:hypothetical protein E4U42_006547 [Claviceps africana]
MKNSAAILASMLLIAPAMALPLHNTTARFPPPRQPPVVRASTNMTAAEQLLFASRKAQPFVPKAIQQRTSSDAMHYQPVLDYDRDSCYNVPAIDAEGNVSEGLKAAYTSNISGGCRDPKHLDNQNVYVRSRCNGGWCAYMYEHYFQKDVGLEHVGGVASGHRHEWENVVVVVKDGTGFPALVAVSAHDGYIVQRPSNRTPPKLRFQGMFSPCAHPKVVYHKNGPGTHCFRFAKIEDEMIKNDKHYWIRGALIEWNKWPSFEVRDRMVRAFANTGTEPKISDAHFAKYLEKALKKQNIYGFNPWIEEGVM